MRQPRQCHPCQIEVKTLPVEETAREERKRWEAEIFITGKLRLKIGRVEPADTKTGIRDRRLSKMLGMPAMSRR